MRFRQEMAAWILGPYACDAMLEGYHLWLKLPEAWPASMLSGRPSEAAITL